MSQCAGKPFSLKSHFQLLLDLTECPTVARRLGGEKRPFQQDCPRSVCEPPLPPCRQEKLLSLAGTASGDCQTSKQTNKQNKQRPSSAAPICQERKKNILESRMLFLKQDYLVLEREVSITLTSGVSQCGSSG